MSLPSSSHPLLSPSCHSFSFLLPSFSFLHPALPPRHLGLALKWLRDINFCANMNKYTVQVTENVSMVPIKVTLHGLGTTKRCIGTPAFILHRGFLPVLQVTSFVFVLAGSNVIRWFRCHFCIKLFVLVHHLRLHHIPSAQGSLYTRSLLETRDACRLQSLLPLTIILWHTASTFCTFLNKARQSHASKKPHGNEFIRLRNGTCNRYIQDRAPPRAATDTLFPHLLRESFSLKRVKLMKNVFWLGSFI